ncbi:unnamed protein product [Ranitomeya imitator]|uniref:Uncharacterized protein n=1 Tax=Ranitomeya imitator TaxID=111125 RepID=A0ABN9LV70_9NEOB|nr:unnamed protein product [Ranitomeya imitator]
MPFRQSSTKLWETAARRLRRQQDEALQTYLAICKDVVMVGLADPEFHAQILQIAISIMQGEKSYNCLPVLMSVLKEITEVCLAQKMSDTASDLDKHLDAIQTIFHKALETAARRLRRQQDEALQAYFVFPVEGRAKYCSAQAPGKVREAQRLRTAVLYAALNRADKVRRSRSVNTRRGRHRKKMGGPGPRRPSDRDRTWLLQSMQVPLGQFIQTVQCWRAASPEVHRGMLSTIIAASVVEISHSLRKVPDPSEIQTPASVSDLPPLSRCLMSIVIKTSSVLSSFVGELAECIAVGEIEGILSLTASLHIIMVSPKGKTMSAAAKNTASIIHRKLKTYREITMEDDDNIERAVYESSMRTLDQLLQP